MVEIGRYKKVKKRTDFVYSKPFGYAFVMVEMLAGQLYLFVPSLVPHLANHTSAVETKQVQSILNRDPECKYRTEKVLIYNQQHKK